MRKDTLREMTDRARPTWNWAGFQGREGECLKERIEQLRAIGVCSFVLRDFGLEAYLDLVETRETDIPLAAGVVYLMGVLRDAETVERAGARLRRMLDAVRRFGGDGVIVVNGDRGLDGRSAEARDALVQVIEAASPEADDLPILFEPMAARLNDFFETPDQALAFARERLPGTAVRLVFDTYHVAAAGNDLLHEYDRLRDHVGHVHLSDFIAGRRPDDDRAFPGGGELPFDALLERIGPDSGCALALEDAFWQMPPAESVAYLEECVR